MKLTIRRGGGLAGVVSQTELDAETLPHTAAEAFAGAVARANLAGQPVPAPARDWPDAQLYEISLEGNEAPVSVFYTDENLPETVRTLMAWVDGRPERVESINP